MVGMNSLPLKFGLDLPYGVPQATLDAIGAVFAENAVNVGRCGRYEHPLGVFVGAPGTGKTRGLLELLTTLRERCRPNAPYGVAGQAALAALQAGLYRADLLSWTYGNGNEPCDADGKVGFVHARFMHARFILSACTRRHPLPLRTYTSPSD